jgi:hypothetical protein
MDEHAETALATNTMASTACLPGPLAMLSRISEIAQVQGPPCMAAEYAVIVVPEESSRFEAAGDTETQQYGSAHSKLP